MRLLRSIDEGTVGDMICALNDGFKRNDPINGDETVTSRSVLKAPRLMQLQEHFCISRIKCLEYGLPPSTLLMDSQIPR